MQPGILVAFDGTARSERALGDAVALARKDGAPLTVLVLAAVEEPSRCCNLQTTSWNRELRRLAALDAERARELLPADVVAHVAIRDGRGSDAVRRVARELGCETIVGGTRRRLPLRRR